MILSLALALRFSQICSLYFTISYVIQLYFVKNLKKMILPKIAITSLRLIFKYSVIGEALDIVKPYYKITKLLHSVAAPNTTHVQFIFLFLSGLSFYLFFSIYFVYSFFKHFSFCFICCIYLLDFYFVIVSSIFVPFF